MSRRITGISCIDHSMRDSPRCVNPGSLMSLLVLLSMIATTGIVISNPYLKFSPKKSGSAGFVPDNPDRPIRLDRERGAEQRRNLPRADNHYVKQRMPPSHLSNGARTAGANNGVQLNTP
jgi:hypothetical protein